MMRCRKWPPLFATMVALLTLVGCAGSTPTPAADQTGEGGEETPRAGGIDYPLEIADDAGRTVTIAREPTRVISFAPSNTEILFSLGVGDRLVAVDDYSDWPAEALADIPKIGGVMNPNYEVIVDLEPDLVFTIGGTDEFVARLGELGIESVVLQPTDFDHIYENILLVGDIMNAPDPAASRVGEMREEVARVRDRVAEVPREQWPRVFFEVWPDPLMTTGPNSFIGYLVRTAGGRLISEDVAGDWVEFSLETLVERDPEIIITTFHDTVEDLERGNRAGWEGLRAVRDGQYHVVDVELVTHPSPRIVEGLDRIARLLHPEIFE